MSELLRWVSEHIFTQDRLAIVLLVLGMLMFMGFLPTPMLGQIEEVRRDHIGNAYLLKQICINTSKSPEAANLCFLTKE
jgi:hypothetical protein